MAGERERLVARLREGHARSMDEAADLLEADAAELADARRYRWLKSASDTRVDLWTCVPDLDKDAWIDKRIALASPRNEAKDKGEGE